MIYTSEVLTSTDCMPGQGQAQKEAEALRRKTEELAAAKDETSRTVRLAPDVARGKLLELGCGGRCRPATSGPACELLQGVAESRFLLRGMTRRAINSPSQS